MTPQELLNKAADVIARDGHGKKYYQDTVTGNVCAYGAMTLAATDGLTADYGFALHRMEVSGMVRALIDQAAALLANRVGTVIPMERTEFDVVVEFNDAPATDGPAMIRKMKEAATMADIGEESPKVVEFEPMPETAPVPEPAPAEPVPA